jgi:hypothetical protein
VPPFRPNSEREPTRFIRKRLENQKTRHVMPHAPVRDIEDADGASRLKFGCACYVADSSNVPSRGSMMPVNEAPQWSQSSS